MRKARWPGEWNGLRVGGKDIEEVNSAAGSGGGGGLGKSRFLAQKMCPKKSCKKLFPGQVVAAGVERLAGEGGG